VHELGGGTSSVAFDYRIMAKRKGYENVRLADKTNQLMDAKSQLEKMGRPTKPSALPARRSIAPVTHSQAIAQPR
jgi:hypothetical protein